MDRHTIAKTVLVAVVALGLGVTSSQALAGNGNAADRTAKAEAKAEKQAEKQAAKEAAKEAKQAQKKAAKAERLARRGDAGELPAED